jgi:hypothetical protein
VTKAELIRELEGFEEDTPVVTVDLRPVRVEYSEGMIVLTDVDAADVGLVGSWEDEGGA